ncbi:organic hydroperoxide resistance protein [Chromobacterium subtsugae]|uniref:Organic hydroperoxide resistance protein n=2 Tax=Chromobacterium subtsugae TaxID=251747 RepID=A0ABS7F7U4_9NEIS|nr:MULTISPECIES: organic hydroperoxide resistance protein [Chromobacterium]KUM02215.1 organic hydroperoxide resistance protein [Chromobacterium subtsugae]KZE86132.1 organic hydroperoxide resistance protein [Chromobacterium sp. F49]MBW7568860.1 organic hydroperoxide resistance protein [Chromobacterium subtsugae]MBW8286061.1 organic hydroperoxide resistance protein [Chromobacterium subtsugae]OBU86324.1 organic hydroperoxide resistance protein [Chromobacterium subtsugae]
MNTLQKVLYTAEATAFGGRDGRAESSDQALQVQLSTPRELGGLGGDGTNPEQLFAAGYSACFIGALKVAAMQAKVGLPAEVSVKGRVSIGPIEHGFGIAARLEVSLPGLERATAEALVQAAHRICPYSNATRGNIEVELALA